MGKRIQEFPLKSLSSKVVNLGYVGENEHTEIVIDCSEVLWDYPNAVVSAVVQPPVGDLYPVVVTRDEDNVIWTISASDVVYAGNGQIQLTFTNDGEIVKSAIGMTRISQSIETTGEAPTPMQNWMDEANAVLAEIEDMTVAASGLPAGSNPTATVSDVSGHKHIAFGIPQGAKGDPGDATIDDTAGVGDSTKVWSANKTATEVNSLSSALTTKADKIGSSPDLIAGTAEQLMSSDVVEDTVPYLYRKSGGGLDIGNRETLEKVVGGTVAWNQFMPELYQSGTQSNITITNNGDGSLTLNGTAASVATVQLDNSIFPLPINHVFVAGLGTDIPSTSYLSISGIRVAANGSGYGMWKNTQYEIGLHLRIDYANGTVFDNLKVWPQVFDLTAMFGPTIADTIYAMEQATAGAGVAWFRKLFPASYYAYNAGELISVNALSRRTVGFNQWDEEWEAGSISSSGQDESGSGRIRSKNHIPVIPGETYFYKGVAGQWFHICYYNAQKQFVGDVNPYFGNNVTIPSGVAYCRFNTNGNYGTTYNHDICINLSDSSRNGEYVPYEKHSYPLDSSLTLRGIPKLDANNKLYYDGDEYASDGAVTRRYGVVNIGSANVSYNALSSGHEFFLISIPDVKRATDAYTIANFINNKYTPDSGAHVYNHNKDKTIAIPHDNNIAMVYDSGYTDLASFKAAMADVYIVYELATPTTEAAEPYAEIQNVDPYGTEEFVSDSIVPVGHSTKYPANLVKKLEGLPWNFATLIAPTESTTTATQPYAVGSYLIFNNTLYKVTSAIANGGTITPGTNVTATTIMAELTALA